MGKDFFRRHVYQAEREVRIMLDNIIEVLKANASVDEWLIGDRKIESAELFFVGKNLDMNRKKNVHHIDVTVYKNFEQDGTKYKGSASTLISPTMTIEEVEEKLEQTALAASFVKNPFYELVSPTAEPLKEVSSQFSTDELAAFMPELVNALYKSDKFDNGKINSCEFFLERIEKRLINSKGVDESYTSYKGQIELVVDWMETGEEVEIIDIIDFSDFEPAKIETIAAETLNNARLRAQAVPLPELNDVPVLLVKENVNEFLRYYIEQSNAALVYQKYSNAKVGENLQGQKITGDSINIELLPEVKGSVANRYIDNSGIKLKPTKLYTNGVLDCYHGDNRHCQYLNVEPTGIIGNVKVEGGKNSYDELKEAPYLELRYFSDFQMDDWTGDFGGEIRLAIYYDGEKCIPVTGGSIVGNIKKVQASMQLSNELQTSNNYICPKAIKLSGVTIAG